MSHMNRGLLAVSPELLVQALCLPSSTEIVGVGTRRDIGGHLEVVLTVEHPDIPPPADPYAEELRPVSAEMRSHPATSIEFVRWVQR